MELDHISTGVTGLDAKDFLEGSVKAKSPHKILYAAEIKVFKAQHGGLEDIRQKLGYSRRKMCRLLMVDPSAWTRWTKDEDRVPPHVYRALEWFLALNEKIYTQPELGHMLTQRYRLPVKIESNVEVKREPDPAKIRTLEARIVDLHERIEEQKRMTAGLIAAGLAIGVCVLTYLLLKWGG